MSVSKFTAALASAHNENTLALANINFDFSLFKVEAPTEYQALGASLSNKRRTEAEAGTQHITARKLGALFDQIPPSTPNLSKAYGLRVSEISANKLVNPRGTKSDGFFTSYVGADGTTIWAAATSGQAAISVHLLACMLARMWSGPEATSVWVELVKSRKREIETMYDKGEPMNLQVLAAAQQDLTRNQLADWDASARAWLQTADEAKMREQKQLMLILKNVRLPVNHNKSVYQSVIQAWKTAMTMMENLIKGMPQLLQDGAVLLGLSAWHLYPDMVVLGDAMADVGLDDSLVAPGGSLTIGLTTVDRSDDDSGVYWSLSLRHLRYYGDPVVSSRSAGSDPSRITFEQLEMVVLGCVLSGWGNAGDDILAAADWFVTLGDFFNRAVQENTRVQEFWTGRSWMNSLVRAAVRLVESKFSERETCLMLVKLGKRKGHSFLADRQLHPPMFGLSSLETLLSLLKEGEERIEFLRNIARDAELSPNDTIIRYSHQGFYEFATALPHLYTTTKRQHSGLERQYQGHVRWTGTPRCNCKKCNRSTCPCVCALVTCSKLCHGKRAKSKCYRTGQDGYGSMTRPGVDNDPRITNLQATGEKHISLDEVLRSTLRNATTDEELVLPRIDAFRTYVADSTTDLDSQPLAFEYLCGGWKTAAIYVRKYSNYSQKTQKLQEHKFQLAEVRHLLKSDAVRAGALAEYLDTDGGNRPSREHKEYYGSLNAFELVAEIYKHLPNATVAVSVLRKTLHRAAWADNSVKCNPAAVRHASWEDNEVVSRSRSRSQRFACIAMLESGGLDIEPRDMKEVMAMSSGNSIYVAAPLLRDPYTHSKPHEIRRVVGNVGRAGIAILIPPKEPRVREPKLESWNVINHADFDGTTRNCFENTTLHLSFTIYEIPISTGTHGGQDTKVFLLESLVSVYDQGKWVADLNVLKHLSRDIFQLDWAPNECMSTPKHPPQSAVPPFQLASIDNWEEFLDKPEAAGIVRAHGNWAARLAFTVLSVGRGDATYVLKDLPCWRCVERTKLPVFLERNRYSRGPLITMLIC